MTKDSMEALNYAFAEFKATNEERLRVLEEKGTTDPIVEEKMQRLNHTIESLEKKLSHAQAAVQRPASSDIMPVSNMAFSGYLRKGIEKPYQEEKSLSSDKGEEGGYLIPQNLSQEIYSSLSTMSPIRQFARVSTISTDAIDLIWDKNISEVGWGQGTVRNETKTTEFTKVRIPLHEMYARPRATQKLLDDTNINIEQWIVQQTAQKMVQLENQAFINGDGNGKPKGLLAYETATKAPWGKFEHFETGEDGAFADDKGYEILLDVLSSLNPAYLNKACWMMPRSTLAEIRKLKNAGGEGYLWQPASQPGVLSSLLGYPVVICDELPALTKGTASNSLIFGSLYDTYHIVDHAKSHLLRDPFSAKPFVEFYVTRRVGGDVVNFESLKVVKFD